MSKRKLISFKVYSMQETVRPSLVALFCIDIVYLLRANGIRHAQKLLARLKQEDAKTMVR